MLPKYAIEVCQIMKIGQIVVLCDLFDTLLTTTTTGGTTSPLPTDAATQGLVSVMT